MATKDARIDTYIRQAAPFARPILQHIRDLVHQGCPAASETIKWRMPFFEYKGLLCGMAAFKQHCALMFWRDVAPARQTARDGMGQFGRLTALADLPSDETLVQYVRAAVATRDAAKQQRPGKASADRKPTSPDDYLASLPDERRAAMRAVHAAIRKAAPKLTPEVMTGMGSRLIGYGKYHFKYPSGREGDWFLIGLAAGKSQYSLHICSADKGGYLVEQHAAKLGKVKTGRSCIAFKKLEDLKLDAAMALVKLAVKTGGLSAVK